jgi:enediyne biosynthesis protein E4
MNSAGTGQCKHSRFTLLSIPAILTSLVAIAISAEPCTIRLRDVTGTTGVQFTHTHGGSGRLYVFEPMTAGLALLDYDRDGDTDIYFLNGAPLPGTKASTPPTNALYRNDGGFKFTDVTKKSGLGDKGYGLGVAAGDYDNDGDLDIYLNNFGPNVLYRNNGDGTFTDVTAKAGLANGDKLGAGANFLDIDGDGDLDLFVSNYVTFAYKAHKIRQRGKNRMYSGPKDYPPSSNNLFRNNGNGTFTDISAVSGIAKHLGAGMGTVCADYDNDGDTDIFVANDDEANFLFRNDRKGKFTEVGLIAGVAYDIGGNEESSMGVGCADYDNNGWLDFYVTGYQQELALLYRNIGRGAFEDATRSSGAGAGTLPHVNWGTDFADFDNDGDRDLFIACGHFDANIKKVDDSTDYEVRNVLLMNTGKGQFTNVSDKCGDALKVKLSSRGTAFGDLDNDGDVDAVVLNWRRSPTIIRNDSPTKNHWLQVRLQGVKTNRDGVGARVKVVSGKLTQIDEVHSGRGYQSHYGMRLHFGLGALNKIDRVEVRWIGGGMDVLKNVRVDQILKITEGSSKIKP